MKKTFAACLILILGATACTRSSDDLPQNNNNVSGDWKVQFYWDEKDETSDFSGWMLRFQSGGRVEAVKGSQVIVGTWVKSSTKFTLDFGADPLFSELNDDWAIVEYSNASIRLKDDNPAQDDQLTLQKL